MAFSRVSKVCASVLLLSGVSGCLGDVELIVPPPTPSGSVTLRLQPAIDDTATARVLGWSAAIPGARVVLTQTGGGTSRDLTASPIGEITISDIQLGDYEVEISRMLSSSERAQLAVGDDATGFVFRGKLAATAGAPVEVRVPANRTRSLIISEWAFNVSAKGYQEGGFLELHNNSDSTIYLDGILIARGFEVAHDYPNFPCSFYTHITSDSTSIWTRTLDAFPGQGRDYPLASHATIAIATDAIDHRPLDPQGIDLRSSSFEGIGIPDVDNPSVRNLIHHGIITLEHGMKWGTLAAVVVIVRPLDVDTLPRQKPRPESGTDWIRIPRSAIMDALWVRSNYAASEYAECPRLVHPVFDRTGANMRGTDEFKEAEFSISRRRLTDGPKPVLQHTRSGSADFVRGPRTPGVP